MSSREASNTYVEVGEGRGEERVESELGIVAILGNTLGNTQGSTLGTPREIIQSLVELGPTYNRLDVWRMLRNPTMSVVRRTVGTNE